MNTAEILAKAADVIEKQGWAQRSFFERATGHEGLPDLSIDARTCPVCARGGISVAVGQLPTFGGGAYVEADAIADWEVVATAEKVFADYLAAREGWPADRTMRPDIEYWNDTSERTAEEVVAALRDCASHVRDAV
ncbi:DUF6197 family protein [Micromonospora harpali]|uniref:Uncharacterized protein n=1 Tax=Micromonospora harpali TaxID=1490225 RepID=A0ABW1I021_9ACTN